MEELLKNETPVSEEELLKEILPLLKDYFYGKISLDGKSINYFLPNGQTFKIFATAM